jgi:molybdopterin converting factor small subunit
MARVTVLLPRMLAEAHGKGRIELEAATLREALERLYAAAPALKFHLCEDSGRFRPHVMCFLNDDRMFDLNSPLRDGDRIAFIQAISGG